MGYLVGMNLAQLLMIYYTHNYYAYLSVKLAFRILENLIITVTADRLYPYLKRQYPETSIAVVETDMSGAKLNYYNRIQLLINK